MTALGWDGRARVLYVEATGVSGELTRRHGLTGRSVGLGAELLVANALMASWIKGDERLMLQLQAEQPPVSFLGEVRADGSVRGRLAPAALPGGGLDLDGLLLAIKSDGMREMYRGVTEIRGEPVARALERHLRTSEQVLARVRIDVQPGDGVPTRVQGLVVERLPRPGGGEAWDAASFEETLAHLDHLDPDDLADEARIGLLLGEALQVLEDRPLAWRCACSHERVRTMLASLGAEELHDMLDKDKGAEVTCQFCNQVYHIGETELGGILASLSPDD